MIFLHNLSVTISFWLMAWCSNNWAVDNLWWLIIYYIFPNAHACIVIVGKVNNSHLGIQWLQQCASDWHYCTRSTLFAHKRNVKSSQRKGIAGGHFHISLNAKLRLSCGGLLINCENNIHRIFRTPIEYFLKCAERRREVEDLDFRFKVCSHQLYLITIMLYALHTHLAYVVIALANGLYAFTLIVWCFLIVFSVNFVNVFGSFRQMDGFSILKSWF